MAGRVDLSVYLVTDPLLNGGRAVEEVVAAALEGGVTLVQMRDPQAKTRAFIETAARLKAVLAPHGIPLVINDRVDVALAVDADGVHVGQSDMDARDVRRLIGPGKILGLSVGNAAEFEASREALGGVDYVGVGAIHATLTKTDTGAAIGIEGLKLMRKLLHHPIVAIGGLNAANAGACIRAGAEGVAVVSAIMMADDPAEAARAVARAVWQERET